MKALGALVALLALALTVAGSHGTLGAFAAPDAMVRVAWSARPERVETCRRVSDEELAKLPVHMRRRLVCEGTTARYALEVTRDGARILADTVRGGGMRHDREVYVSRELRLAPGPSRLVVRFVRLDSSATGDEDESAERAVRDHAERREEAERQPALADRGQRETDERRRRRAEAIPPELTLDTLVTLAPRAVLLVTYDEIRRQLVATTGPRWAHD